MSCEGGNRVMQGNVVSFGATAAGLEPVFIDSLYTWKLSNKC